MPSRKIELEKNKIYHIFNCGFQKQQLFFNERDYERFFQKIEKYRAIYKGIKLLSYSVLPNHFHLILSSSKSGQEILDFMRKLQ